MVRKKLSFYVFLIILSVVVSSTAMGMAGKVSSSSKRTFSFGWVSDTHIMTTVSTESCGDRADRLKQVIKEMDNNPKIDFIVHSGDMIENTANAKQYKAFNELMRPVKSWYPIAGNHDVDNRPGMDNINLYQSLGYGRGEKKQDYYGFVHKSAAFFVINSQSYASKDPIVQKRAEDQLVEMDAFFTKYKNVPNKFVCAHAPIFIKSSNEADDYFNIKSAYRKKIIDVMKKHQVKYYLCGHRHGNHEAADPDGSGITVLTQTALSWGIGKGQTTGYCIFTVSPKGLKKEYVEVK